MLQRLEKGTTVETVSKFISFNPFTSLPPKYKSFYGIRYCGIHNNRPMFYGFDLFYQTTGSGLNLEKFLEFCFTNNLHIDWYNFQRTSKERGKWTFETLIRKLNYPVTEIYGRKYWEELQERFIVYEKSLLR
jgi:hypothetical protein